MNIASFSSHRRSAVTDLDIPDSAYFHASFYIKTKSKYSIPGDAGEDYLCLQPRVSATNPLDVFTEVCLLVVHLVFCN